MAETVSGRLPDELVAALDELAQASGQTRSETLRIVVQRGVDRVRLDRALEAYRRGDASLGRASEMAGIHVTAFLDAIRRAGVPFRYGSEDIEDDLAWASGA